MKVINMDRGAGKTTFLVALSAENNIPIVSVMPPVIQARADALGVKIPKPMSVREAIESPRQTVYVDDLNFVAARALGQDIDTCTITEHDELMCERYCGALNYYDRLFDEKKQH